MHSHADWTHPLYPLWIEMGLDDNADDGLCFIVGDGHFAIDTLERAIDRTHEQAASTRPVLRSRRGSDGLPPRRV